MSEIEEASRPRVAQILHAASPIVSEAIAWMREAPTKRRILACADEASVRLLQSANPDLEWWRFVDAQRQGVPPRWGGESGPIERGVALAGMPWPSFEGSVEVWGPETCREGTRVPTPPAAPE